VSTFVGLEKAELHAHLNGSLPPAAMRQLLIERGLHEERDVGIPAPFMEPVRGLEEYFAPWALLRALPTDEEALVHLVTAAARELADDGVSYAELRSSIVYIAEQNAVAIETAVEWLLSAFAVASRATGVDLRLVASIVRERSDVEQAARLLAALGRYAEDKRLVAVDLCGNEEAPIDPEIAGFFRAAKDDHGLGVTIHAGETGDGENVRWALERCRAERIGHGLAAAKDPALLDMLVERGTCIEVCLTSNRLTGLVPRLSTHPVLRFHDFGVTFVLCADNPQLHALSLSHEYAILADLLGDDAVLAGMHDQQCRNAFTEKP
jgi:adenosine deaminase